MSRNIATHRSLLAIAAVLSAGTGAQLAWAAPTWDGKSLPITIEVTRDVLVGRNNCAHLERAKLCSATDFVIAKGRRFKMVENVGEGECRIEVDGKRYLLGSCPWMPGFQDTQSDVFVVVEFRNR